MLFQRLWWWMTFLVTTLLTSTTKVTVIQGFVLSKKQPTSTRRSSNIHRIQQQQYHRPLTSSVVLHSQKEADDNDHDHVSSDNNNVNDNTSSTEEFNWNKLIQQSKSFYEMAVPYFKESKTGRWLFAGMVGMTLANSGVSVMFSYVIRDFWTALSSKDADQFAVMLQKFGGALVIAVPVSVFYRFQREQLSVQWREWMTDRVLQLYYSNRVYYSLERGDGEIDNPDQRIAEDVRTFTAFSLTLFITVVTSVIDLVSFSTILYSIQPQLFGAIIAYATFGTVTTTSLGKKLVKLNYEKLQKEADLRYNLVRIRENAESIAFYGGEDIEGKEVSNRLRKVVDNKKEINVAQRNLEFFTTAYSYLIQVLPVSVVAPQYFAGSIPLGVVSQSNGAFNHILNDLSVIVNQFEQLSSFSAGIDRLSSFMKSMRYVDLERSNDAPLMTLPNATISTSSETLYSVAEEADSHIELLLRRDKLESDKIILNVSNLSLLTPDRKRELIQNLGFSLKSGQNLLIVGNSGAGKSSFLRAIAGLWTAGAGTIERPINEDVYFLPQRPYCTIGTLKDQLLYPSAENLNPEDYPEGHILTKSHILKQSLTDEYLLGILDNVGLKDVAVRAGDGDAKKGLYDVKDWSNTLSLGEQQRLAFGRLLVNKPRLAILDEATSALDSENEAKMYQLLRSMDSINGSSSQQLTYISVGHRPSLLLYHNMRLRLNGVDSDHTLEEISSETIPEGVRSLQNM